MYEKGWPPGPSLVGNPITTATPEAKAPIHHVATTATITTITPPPVFLGFMGPLHLVADSVFNWTSSGNIALGPGTTLVVGRAYQFIYDRATNKWYPLGQDS